jgi:hypothetical protein
MHSGLWTQGLRESAPESLSVVFVSCASVPHAHGETYYFRNHMLWTLAVEYLNDRTYLQPCFPQQLDTSIGHLCASLISFPLSLAHGLHVCLCSLDRVVGKPS